MRRRYPCPRLLLFQAYVAPGVHLARFKDLGSTQQTEIGVLPGLASITTTVCRLAYLCSGLEPTKIGSVQLPHAIHWAQSHTLVAGAIWYICTPVLVQPKVSHFFMVSLLIGLQDESRRVFPASGCFHGINFILEVRGPNRQREDTQVGRGCPEVENWG